MQVAIYDQDEPSAHILAFVVRRRGHQATVIDTLDDVQQRLPSTPAVIILGLRRVDDDGIEFVRRVRQRYPDALLYLAGDEFEDHAPIAALTAGATDMFRKPFHPHELIMRAEIALAAHQAPKPGSAIARAGDLEVDLDRYYAVKDGRELILTKLELRLLYCLVQHCGRVSPTDRLLSFGWETRDLAGSSLKTHISHLRQKLRDAGGIPIRIRSRHLLGYTLELAEEAAA